MGDQDEFKQVLYKALRVPPNFDLPPSRLKHFWKEIDSDGSGKAVFEEFLEWYLKYFSDGMSAKGKNNSGRTPHEDFYKQIRRIGEKYLDPPVYRRGEGEMAEASAAEVRVA